MRLRGRLGRSRSEARGLRAGQLVGAQVRVARWLRAGKFRKGSAGTEGGEGGAGQEKGLSWAQDMQGTPPEM